MKTATYDKEAILDVPYNWSKKKLRKFVKGYEYTIYTFGLYNLMREGNIKELSYDIKDLFSPKALSSRHPNWSWELKGKKQRGLLFKGTSSSGSSMNLEVHPLTSKDITENIIDLQVIFNLLKVPFPREYRIELQEQEEIKVQNKVPVPSIYQGLDVRLAKADVNPIRQRSQFTCVTASTCMALNAVGVKCNEDQVNEVIGAKAMHGARWEEVLACAQYFGCRATLTCPATLTQVKEWTDQGKPVLIAWNPEGRDWSHASLIYDVTGERGNFTVHIADPNIPNPDKTTREVSEDDFYAKWYEKWPNYLVRRPALMIEREICENGRQLMANTNTTFSQAVKEIISSVRHLGYLAVRDKWSTSDRTIVIKVSVPGLGHYSLEFDFNLKSVSLYEGTRKIREISEISKFPEIIRHLPSQTSKMASSLLPCTQEELGLTDKEVSNIMSLVDRGIPIKEHAIQIAELIPKQKVKSNLSLIDLIVKDLNSNMISRVATIHMGGKQ